MIINAIRLAAFRRFTSPVAVEDFAPGISVLAGPNEMGKSTIFRALEAAFLTRHKVTGAVLEDMRPASSGEPLVEADFSIGERRYRIRKQFGRGSTAVLSDVTAARVIARNAEAEDELARLVAGKHGIDGAFGLVWVRQQRALAKPDPDTDPLTGRAKDRGELGALNAAVRGEIEAAAAGETLEDIKARTAKALDQLLTPARNAPRKNGPLDVARTARDNAQSELEKSERAADAAERRLREIAAIDRQLANLNDPEAAARRRVELADLDARLRQETERRRERDEQRSALRVATLERERATEAVKAIADAKGRLEGLKARALEAHALQATISQLAEELNRDPATTQAIDRLVALAHQCDLARAELERDPAVVEVTLEPGGKNRIEIDGKPLADDLRLAVNEAVRIAIPGIGALRILPPGEARAAAARDKIKNAEAEIANMFATLSVADLDGARARAGARAAKVKELDGSRARLSGLAPGGIGRLDHEVSELETRAAGGDATEAAEKLKSAAAAEHVARERFDTLAKTVLDEPAFKALTAKFETARAADAAAARDVERLENRIENLKSEMAGADEDGIAGELDARRDTLQRLDREVKRLEAEGQALLLLMRTLTGIEAKARDKVFLPVTRRLQPYLSAVFGNADLAFKDGFAVSTFSRGGEVHDFARLSDGTREQLSVLVRLAYAELLSEQGEAVPLLLDDPLVYSDDERLARLCSVLEDAAKKLQVIVLTCRQQAFQKLSGRRMSVTTWQPEKTFAQ